MLRRAPNSLIFTFASLRMRSGQSDHYTRLFIKDRVAAGVLKDFGGTFMHTGAEKRRKQEREAAKLSAVHEHGGLIVGNRKMPYSEAQAARFAQLDAAILKPQSGRKGGIMSRASSIEWTNATWNFLLGCSNKSAGCQNCYAILTCWRLSHNPHPAVAKAYEGLVKKLPSGRLMWTGRVNVVHDRLHLPMEWKKPLRIFVNSQSDFFHENVPDDVMIWQ